MANTPQIPTDLATAATVIRDLASQQVQAPIDVAPNVKLVFRPEGIQIEEVDLEQYQTAPNSIREQMSFHDPESFIGYVNEFKLDGKALLLFDDEAATFTCVFGFSEPGKPTWGKHVARMTLRHSDEWKVWDGHNKKASGQLAFGRFIEENSLDIVQPDGATLLELVMAFEATKTAAFKSSQRLKDGRVQFQYTEDIQTGAVEIPESITLGIPVYLGQPKRQIKLRFRYRIEESKLQIWYEIAQRERLLRAAAEDVISAVRVGTELQVMCGKRLSLA